ncbi:MAG: peptidoglycan editing factor PgeF [Bacillota bacterium]
MEKNGVKYYIVPTFAETGLVKHGFSTRIGGRSDTPYDSLNLAFHCGDNFEKVKENRKIFAQAVGIPSENIVAADQIHGDNIYNAGKLDRGKGALEQETVIKETDALITNEPGVALIAFYADCVPIMLLDPVQKAIAVIHAGWKGTAAKIASKTVEKMKESFNSNPGNILAGICPSIGPCHYEVDQPVIEKIQESHLLWTKILNFTGEGKAQLNLWEANRLQLLEAGLTDANISVAQICTFCNPQLLFSYRYYSGKTGRLAGLIMLKDD